MEMRRKLNITEDQICEIKRQYNLLQKDILIEREYRQDGYSEREPFTRDYSRILYSSAFRRLQGKMQIMGISSTAFFRNRLTHSLEVEQIAHSIAKLLAYSCGMEGEMYDKDIFVIHAAALAHDIGHPAFGHKGERVLNELAHIYDANFEGNAQNFRILRKIEKKDAPNKGLNLTWRTLLAVNKYIVEENKDVKKFIYSEDFRKLNEIREKSGLVQARTLDVQIIELADDIAYAVHDLDDALSLNLFTIDDLLYEYSQDKTTQKSYEQLKDIVNEAKSYALKSNSYGIQEEYAKVFRCRLVSLLTDRFIHDITIKKVSDKDAKTHGTKKGVHELSLNKLDELCHSLKDRIFAGVMRSPEVTLYELKGEAIIKSLFYLFAIDKRNDKCRLLPMEYRPQEANKEDPGDIERYKIEKRKNSIDYIAGMMDQFAIKEYEKYFSKTFESISLKEVQNIDNQIQTVENIQIENFNQKLKLSGKNGILEISQSNLKLNSTRNEII